jgi:pyruvate, water dikinase
MFIPTLFSPTKGAVDPDEFYVHKPTFKKGFKSVLTKTLGQKQVKMVYSSGSTREPVVNQPTPRADRRKFCLNDEEVLVLADAAIKIEDHYSGIAGETRAMDIEWAKDGVNGDLFIVQARPETGAFQRSSKILEEFIMDDKTGVVRTTGRAVGAKISTGRVRRIMNPQQLEDFKPGEVLVADTTTPDWEPVLKTAAAIVTNRGGRTCHAAIVARELGIPAVVGAEHASEVLKDGDIVTVSCAEGAVGMVYEGGVNFHRIETDLTSLKKPQHTKINVILASPELAFKVSRMPSDGVGLARMEFIINDHIQVHPMAALHPGKVSDLR